VLLHLPDGRRTAEAVTEALIADMQALPPQLRRSLAWDQGKEMALHAQVTAQLSMPVFFCPKSSPWLRGTNENTNGLLRQYFPKGTDLSAHGPEVRSPRS
jgi:transposase, IS30 family